MQVSVENTGGLARRMTVQVPAERVDREVESRLHSMSRTVKLDGFRPGKVPLKVIEQKYGKQVRLEVITQVVNATMQEALSQENIRPAGQPQVEPGSAEPGQPLEYVATFEIFPELGDSLDFGFEIERPVVEITDADVDAMLENLRSQRAMWNDVDRAASNDDQVVIDFEGMVDGAPFAGNKADNVPLVLGSGQMIAGFEEQLTGVRAGDETSIEVTFPEDYPSKEVAGRQAVFNVRVHAVKERRLPEMDDDFATLYGVAEGGLARLRADVTGNMQRELDAMIRSRMKQQVFDGLLARNAVDVPQNLVASEAQQLQARNDKPSLSDEEVSKAAERRVRLGLFVSELARTQRMQINPERVREVIEAIAASYENPDEVVQWYYSNQEMLANVQSSVLEEQVVQWVVDHSGAQVSDRSMAFDELVNAARESQGRG